MARILLNTQLISSAPSYKSAIAVPSQASPPGSDVALIIAAFLCALVCCVGLFAFVRCAWLRRISTASAQRFGCQLATNRGGLKKKDVQRLPKYVYGSSSSSGNADADTSVDCVICLTEYTEGDEIRVLPQCEHVFHVQCIDTWLSSHSSCPSCRQVIVVVAGCQNCCEIPECLRSTATTSTATPAATPECLPSAAAMPPTPAVTVPIKAGSGYGLPSTATTSTATPAVTVPIKA